MQIYDAQQGYPWDPTLYYNDIMIYEGLIHATCDFYVQNGSQPQMSFRQYPTKSAYYEAIGINVNSVGQLNWGGKTFGLVPYNQWFRVQFDFALGSLNTKKFNLTITYANSTAVSYTDLAYTNPNFCVLHWVGFVSNSAVPSSYFVDNLHVYTHAPSVSIPTSISVNVGDQIAIPVSVSKVK